MSAVTEAKADSPSDALHEAIASLLQEQDVVILPPMDVTDSLRLVSRCEVTVATTMLDPWYNKGVGGVRDDYQEYIVTMMRDAAEVSPHVYLWGFPEIIACFVERVPPPLSLVTWLTWYYKNNPSVIRGWRSAQMACLHLSHPGARMYPEHFLNEAQKQKQAQGKLRYMPGPTSVIEEPLDSPSDVIESPLNIGFVGRKEQTGHPAQKPVAVFKRLYEMTTAEGDVIFDPMSGSGTTGDAARQLGRKAIICDSSEEYTQIAEKRLGVKRIPAL